MHGVTGTCNRENCSCRLKGPEIQTKVVLILYLPRPMQDECVESYMDEHWKERCFVWTKHGSKILQIYLQMCHSFQIAEFNYLQKQMYFNHLKVGPPFVFLSYIIWFSVEQ